jgi:hypothetical protein
MTKKSSTQKRFKSYAELNNFFPLNIEFNYSPTLPPLKFRKFTNVSARFPEPIYTCIEGEGILSTFGEVFTGIDLNSIRLFFKKRNLQQKLIDVSPCSYYISLSIHTPFFNELPKANNTYWPRIFRYPPYLINNGMVYPNYIWDLNIVSEIKFAHFELTHEDFATDTQCITLGDKSRHIQDMELPAMNWLVETSANLYADTESRAVNITYQDILNSTGLKFTNETFNRIRASNVDYLASLPRYLLVKHITNNLEELIQHLDMSRFYFNLVT